MSVLVKWVIAWRDGGIEVNSSCPIIFLISISFSASSSTHEWQTGNFAVPFQNQYDKVSVKAARGRLVYPGKPTWVLLWNKDGQGGGECGGWRRVLRRWQRSGPVCPKVRVNSGCVYEGSAFHQVWGTGLWHGDHPTPNKSRIPGDAKAFRVVLIQGQENQLSKFWGGGSLKRITRL